MDIQYRHTGKFFQPPVGEYVNGDLVPAASPQVYETVCRIEPRTGSQYITGEDGNKISFFGIVYIPLADFAVAPGTLFEVWDGDRLITRSKVLQFSKGLLNIRIWL